MKKIILILIILTTATSTAFAAESFDTIIDNDTNDDAIELMFEKDNIESIKPETIKSDDKKSEIKPDEKKADKVNGDKIKAEKIKEDVLPKNTLLDKVAEINSLQSDEEKVKEWAKFNSEKNYVIIDKKECSAIVYGKDGNEIKSFEIGIGKEIGDDFNDTRGLKGKPKNTTPAGEYTLITNIYNKSAYGDLTLSLGTKANKDKNNKKVVALHKVPKFRQSDRLKKFNDGNLANNRMSHGCINFLEKDFKELTKYIHGGLKVYVLPEEKDNKLILTKNDKGNFELAQTKY